LSDLSTPPAASAPSRGRRWLLVGSLALNLLVAGALLALWIKGPPPHGRHPPSQTAFGIMRFSGQLPPERREAVRKHLRDARDELGALRDELRAARTKAAEALASPNYSAAELQAALEAISAADNRLREMGTATMLRAIGELTPEDRQKLSEAWSRRLERMSRRKGKPDKDTPPEAPGDKP
jgi:uncharacterized membrane protein